MGRKNVEDYTLGELKLKRKPNSDCVTAHYIQNGDEVGRIMYGAGELEADALVAAVNAGHWRTALDIMKAHPLYITGNGSDLMAKMEHQLASSPVYDPDPLEEAVEAILDNEADTFGIGQPNRKSTAEWEPDVPEPDVDLMKSIRDACTR